MGKLKKELDDMGRINRQGARLVGGSHDGKRVLLGKAEKHVDRTEFNLEKGELETERYVFTEKDADGTRVYVLKEATK